MKKFKDLIYDYNDILLAILIIIVAGAVIFVKVSDIMAYPSFAKNEPRKEQDVDFSDVDLDPIDVQPVINDGTDVIGEDDPDDSLPITNPEPTTPPTPTGDVKFEVKQGEYLSNVASNLKKAGLIEDSSAFVKKVEEMKLESKLQIGEFTIPAGSSMEDIAKIITRTK